MKKLMLAAAGLTGILASCGSYGSAPDGSGNARVVDITTEYTLQGSSPAQYVGCDAVSNPTDPSRATSTQVVVKFATGGSVTQVDVTLKGTTNSDYDETQTFTVGDLSKDSSGNYQAVFDFKSATNDFLPASIIVEPNDPVRTPRAVTASNLAGSFYADLKVYTSTGSSFMISSVNLSKVNVYRNCTLTGTAQPLTK
ncbi:hypothetical protein [Deinococcus soli (ex Cha et al. 2016)]|uniref:Uncharacterized protein n=2 Tax=Deinococcus soli (ex Cha et al. 2016) TaxID=1309411 RepID=A0ACC6KB56_9DEIO|nr:hypothetical protein [Deinococcus soli (ex Cha et al. 2016)]MDR6216591.1 hypothetical protein [Deinococcus soli (ex Cha et al. 2016)]MDR6327412.1 hypothetical protein [Deinococcus soli (ex Cha et al. 2016)]MDR6749687.1 hypothetical protein [Deinococcus soli (ex Cha et al. 2016)]